MWGHLKNFWMGLVYENGAPSRTGFIALLIVIIPLFTWTFITIYLAVMHARFDHYDSMTAGAWGSSTGGGITAAVNKYINATKNSVEGQPFDKIGAPVRQEMSASKPPEVEVK